MVNNKGEKVVKMKFDDEQVLYVNIQKLTDSPNKKQNNLKEFEKNYLT